MVQPSSSNESDPDGRELISLRETAIKLDVCEKTVRRMSDDGEFGPMVKVRGSTKLFLKYVRAYIERLEQAALGGRKIAL